VTPWRVIWCLVPVALTLVVQDRFALSVLALAGIQALFVASWDLVGGVSGQMSLGHALPFGGGAYAAALVSAWGLAAPPAVVASGVVAGGLLGALQGGAGARLHRLSLALVTLAMAECAHELSGMLRFRWPRGIIVGGEGGVPAILFPADEVGAARLVAVVLATSLVGLLWIANSKIGLAMRTVRADDRLAAASGIDVARVRLLAFVIAGALAGLAGGLTATTAGRAAPSMLSLEPSLSALAIAGIGGLGTILGPASVAYALTAILQWLDLPGTLRLTLYALLLIGTGLAAPVAIRLGWLARAPR
jgi:branched-chain amino acid transport system permease protein